MPEPINLQRVSFMASGIHSTVQSLNTRLHLRWVPKWYEAFSDPAGGFYERLGKGFKPVFTGQRRLVTQCRQLSIYSDACERAGKPLYKNLQEKFEFILAKYHDPKTGLWRFSLNDAGNINDPTCDLYALSFVIFSFSHYYRATNDGRAQVAALDVLNLIDSRFRLSLGLAEALDANGNPILKLRRQNPHMHLLEACLFAYDTWGDKAYEAMADEMIGLFQNYFYDSRRNALVEFLTDDLKPDPEKGHHLEAGHYFEWVWLLKKHAVLKGDASMHDTVALKLLDWADKHGWDETHGGIYDTISPEGRVITDTKRIWPFCEALKANALMLSSSPDRQAIKDRVSEMVDVFEEKYMQERGFWTEWLNRDLSPAADYMPGTTPYHVYFGITETWDVLEERGGSMSLTSGISNTLYGFRRALSRAYKSIAKA